MLILTATKNNAEGQMWGCIVILDPPKAPHDEVYMYESTIVSDATSTMSINLNYVVEATVSPCPNILLIHARAVARQACKLLLDVNAILWHHRQYCRVLWQRSPMKGCGQAEGSSLPGQSHLV